MAATMRKRDGKYIVTVHDDGKRKQKTYSVKRDAERATNRANNALSAGGTIDKVKDTESLNHFIDVWFKLVVCDKQEPLAKGTHQRYEGIYRNKIRDGIGKMHINEITRTFLLGHFKQLKADDHTRSDIAGRLCIINGGLSEAADLGMGDGVPVGLIKSLYKGKKRKKPVIKPFTPAETDAILANTRKAEYPLVLLLFRSGMRLGEVLGLNWDAVNFMDGYVIIKRSFRNGHLGGTKTGIERTIPVDTEVLNHLEQLKVKRNKERLKGRDQEAVFTRNGARLSQNSFRYSWKRVLERTGLDHRKVHTTRHTVATMLLNGGYPVKLVAEILGHSVQTLLSTYSHLMDSEEDKKRDMLSSLFAVESSDLKHTPKGTSNTVERGNASQTSAVIDLVAMQGNG